MRTLIRKGERSQQVADIQIRLRSVGLEVGDDAGYFGEATEQAVRTFQQQRNILVDGIVGPHTWAELVETGWRLGDRPLYLTRPAMRGDDIAALQAQMNALGFDAGQEDGILGPDTVRAFRAFQTEYGLPEDGIFGPRSFEALGGLRADRPQTAAALREELKRSQVEGLHDILVMLDPGHGGPDPGTLGTGGLIEADACWDIARSIAGHLADGGARVRFTRTETENPDTTERARRANDLDADLFVSIHLNAHDGQLAQGASTYHWPRSRSGQLLAEAIQLDLVAIGISDCRSHARLSAVERDAHAGGCRRARLHYEPRRREETRRSRRAPIDCRRDRPGHPPLLRLIGSGDFSRCSCGSAEDHFHDPVELLERIEVDHDLPFALAELDAHFGLEMVG